MKLIKNQSLQLMNTLALSSTARYFVCATHEKDLVEAVSFAQQALPWVVLGQGSNVVLQADFPGVVIQNQITGIDTLENSADTVVLEVGAGETWHSLVEYCLQRGYYGLENLALIPGTVGAAPVQNIGAYGVEVCSFILHVKAFDTKNNHWLSFSNPECLFSYRDSLFKREPNRYLISHVCFQLHKKPTVNIAYDALRQYFSTAAEVITPQQVFDAVVEIRRARLPDPAVLPNAGSFFKNPIIPMEQYRDLLKRYPELVAYPLPAKENKPASHIKLAAAWLIDQAGWKGVREGCVGVHAQQALVLVNYGGAHGRQLLEFADKIRMDIKHRYQVELELEPVII